MEKWMPGCGERWRSSRCGRVVAHREGGEYAVEFQVRAVSSNSTCDVPVEHVFKILDWPDQKQDKKRK